MKAKLKDEVVSHGKGRRVYGNKNDTVSIISIDDKVAIVEHNKLAKKGFRFPCSIEHLILLDDGKGSLPISK